MLFPVFVRDHRVCGGPPQYSVSCWLTGYEIDAIAAVVLGTRLGGSGSISGTFIVCLILAVMRNGLTILSISNYQQLLTGLIVRQR